MSSSQSPLLQMMFGPKKTSLLACVPICLAWVLMSRAEDIYVVYTSRMLTGHILKHICLRSIRVSPVCCLSVSQWVAMLKIEE